MSEAFKIDGLHKLLAVERAILTAKFGAARSDDPLPGSPILAEIIIELSGLIDDIYLQEANRPAYDSRIDRRNVNLDTHKELWDRCISYVVDSDGWHEISDDKKSEFVRLLFSPYVLSNKLVNKFLAIADKKAELR